MARQKKKNFVIKFLAQIWLPMVKKVAKKIHGMLRSVSAPTASRVSALLLKKGKSHSEPDCDIFLFGQHDGNGAFGQQESQSQFSFSLSFFFFLEAPGLSDKGRQ